MAANFGANRTRLTGQSFASPLPLFRGRDKEIPDERIVHATDRLGSKTAVCRRSGERPESLRVFGRLPGTGVMRYAEAGVRKASGEETAGSVRRRSTNAEDCPFPDLAPVRAVGRCGVTSSRFYCCQRMAQAGGQAQLLFRILINRHRRGARRGEHLLG